MLSCVDIRIYNPYLFSKISQKKYQIQLDYPYLYSKDFEFDLNQFKILDTQIENLKLQNIHLPNFQRNILNTLSNENSLIDIFSNSKTSDCFVKKFKLIHSEILNAIILDDLKYFEKLLNEFVGFGRGLTPAGDDFLYGLLATWKTFLLKKHFIESLENFIKSNPDKFSLYSYSFLSSLINGHIVSELKILFKKLIKNEDYSQELKYFSEHGFTSGADIFTGILTALIVNYETKNSN